MSKFNLSKKASAPGWWILSCPEHGLTIEFEEHKFNETQEVRFEDEHKVIDTLGASGIAAIMREVGDWLSNHAYSVAMPVPTFELSVNDESGLIALTRHKFPRMEINVLDHCDSKQLSNAFKAASEGMRKLFARRLDPDPMEDGSEFTCMMDDNVIAYIMSLSKECGITPGEVIAELLEAYIQHSIKDSEHDDDNAQSGEQDSGPKLLN